MRMSILVGVSGSGKSTKVCELQGMDFSNVAICSADDYFMDEEGNYNFDFEKLKEAHAECQRKARLALANPRITHVIIDNTNCNEWEQRPYMKMAREFGVPAELVLIHDNTLEEEDLVLYSRRNRHGVSLEVIQKQYEKFCKWYESGLT